MTYTGEPSYSLLDAIKLPLLFHAGGAWDDQRKAEWLRITGTNEATAKVMCDHLRSALSVHEIEPYQQPADAPPDPNDVGVLVDRIRPILAHRNPAIQSAALADLLALYIAGHQATEGDKNALDELREEVLAMHMQLVRDLIPANDAFIKDRMKRKR